MAKSISKSVGAHELEPVSLSELIHQHVRVAIETAVHEELEAALGTGPYERNEVRRDYRNASGSGRSRDRLAQLRSRCLGPPSSEAPARRSGRRRSSRAISGECRTSMKR